MGSVDHAPSYCLLLLIIRFFFLTLSNLDHVLEIQEATEGISVSLSLHHGKSLLVMGPFAVDWARSDMHLLILVFFHILLVLHMLVILEVLIFLFHIWELLGGTLLLGRWSRALGLLTSAVDVVGLDLEVLLFLGSRA